MGERKREKNEVRKEQRGDASYSISMGAKCFAFKLGFLPLICKASLIS